MVSLMGMARRKPDLTLQIKYSALQISVCRSDGLSRSDMCLMPVWLETTTVTLDDCRN